MSQRHQELLVKVTNTLRAGRNTKGFIKFQRNGTRQSPTWKFSPDAAVRSCQHRDLIELSLRADPGLEIWGDEGGKLESVPVSSLHGN